MSFTSTVGAAEQNVVNLAILGVVGVGAYTYFKCQEESGGIASCIADYIKDKIEQAVEETYNAVDHFLDPSGNHQWWDPQLEKEDKNKTDEGNIWSSPAVYMMNSGSPEAFVRTAQNDKAKITEVPQNGFICAFPPSFGSFWWYLQSNKPAYWYNYQSAGVFFMTPAEVKSSKYENIWHIEQFGAK